MRDTLNPRTLDPFFFTNTNHDHEQRLFTLEPSDPIFLGALGLRTSELPAPGS